MRAASLVAVMGLMDSLMNFAVIARWIPQAGSNAVGGKTKNRF
jgi:hypothetical protein